MARIAFILLCHRDPEGIIDQARRLTATGDCMAIHFDARANPADYARIRAELAGNPNVTFARQRVRCGWGGWSLVQGTLNATRAALDSFPDATHFLLLSGDCMAIKSAEYVHAFLDAEDVDYVESFDFFDSDWIKTGIKEDRLIYRHPFNERRHKRLFYASLNLQRRLGLRRTPPADLQMMIGSQWWCLRRHTVEAVFEFTRGRRDVMRFFRTTWIPDETFFQTLVRHLVPEREIRSRTLTFKMFTDYGMPVTLYNDHYDLLLGQDFLFARKISPDARELKARLGDLYAARGIEFRISNEGERLYTFLAGRGRSGRRFARRFWETEASLGADRELMIVVCKKWHVAKRLARRAGQVAQVPVIEYLFNEEGTPLPDLGGIETTLEKRARHHRALMRMLYGYHRTDRLIICLDPSSIDLMQDFCSDRATVRILEVDCRYSDDNLAGHARRVGLAGEHTGAEALGRLLPSIRHDLRHESDRIRDSGFSHLHRIREGRSVEENAVPLAAFLDISVGAAREIAAKEHMFDD
ncbi:DUF5928 domain-containing protein [Defluviimonas sp. D31]|uniref:DUF5928 domain-containing protein n=1 Tax=Defluviimonas sp. D31 TaxID=3083253 RepID=UPI00296E439D|nr:DUF5928 domain-containing protein [Defluviimonas sp. D31]MDW4549974.1 DUF5928 domain-containing protein [Defluviimonas sp. D31]